MHPLAKLSSGALEVVCLHITTKGRVSQRTTAEVVDEGDQSGELVVIETVHVALDAGLKAGQVLEQESGALGLGQWRVNVAAVAGVASVSIADGLDSNSVLSGHRQLVKHVYQLRH